MLEFSLISLGLTLAVTTLAFLPVWGAGNPQRTVLYLILANNLLTLPGVLYHLLLIVPLSKPAWIAIGIGIALPGLWISARGWRGIEKLSTLKAYAAAIAFGFVSCFCSWIAAEMIQYMLSMFGLKGYIAA